MAIVPVRVKRGGLEKTGEIGQANGQSKWNMITTDIQEPFDQPKKEGVLKIEILFYPHELNSELKDIRTTFGEAYISPNGLVVSEITEKTMLTNEQDKAGFTAMLADLILRFVHNGKVRALEGHNDKPVYYSQDVTDGEGNIIHHAGEVIVYTEVQENEEPTGGYYPPKPLPENPA